MKKILFFVFVAVFFYNCKIFAYSYEEGDTIISNLISQKKGKLFIYGIATENPSLMFAFAKDDDWNNLTEEDKKSICIYMKKNAEKAAFNPQKYIDVPKDAPFYEQAQRNAKKLCISCWEVSGPEHTYVFGDGIWKKKSKIHNQKDLRFSSVFK